MKLLVLLVVSCLALHNGNGAPATAVYKFVRCNPEGGQANCVTQQTAEMEWTPDLPTKLPASALQHLGTVEDEKHPEAEDDRAKTDGEVMMNYEGESPASEEGGSGGSEDYAFQAWTTMETGSGDEAMDQYTVNRSLPDDPKPAEQELIDEHFLQF